MQAKQIPTTSRAVIYARYSSHSQRDVSIDQQIRECKTYASRNGIEVIDIYEDRALSGTSDRRPGFQKMISDSAKADWSYVIVYSLDRFARDRYDSAVYKRELKNNGVKVLSAMENISDDPTGVLVESLMEGLAEYYSKELSRKIRRGMDDNAMKCMSNGHIPLGYARGSDGRFVIVPDEAATVKEIFVRIKEGDRICDIIRDLNARGCKTKRGKAWTKSSFNRLLSNERYMGVYIYGDVRVVGGMPQIIDETLFHAVQYQLSNKPNARSGGSPQRRRRDNGVYLLTGKLYCGKCKQPMVGISGQNKNGLPYFYYICKGKRIDHTCDKSNVRRDHIERLIVRALKDYMLNDSAIEALADMVVAHQNATISNSEVEMLRSRLADIRKSLSNLIRAIEAGVFSGSTQTRLLELETQEKQVAAQLAIAEEEAESRLTRNQIIAVLKLYQNGNVDDIKYQETLIDTFLTRAYIYDDHVKIIFNLGGKKEKDVTLPFDIDDVPVESGACIKNHLLHQTLLYEHSTHIIMIGDLFVFSIRLR